MKKSELRTIVRTMVKEEVAISIKEVLKEITQPTTKSKKKVVEKKQYSQNSVLNEVLNETANDTDYKTMGDGVYDSSRMNEIIGAGYKEDSKEQLVSSFGDPDKMNDGVKNALTRDYSELLKTISKKRDNK